MNTLTCHLSPSGLTVGSDGPGDVEVVTVAEAVEWREELARCEVFVQDTRPGRTVSVYAFLPGESGILPGVIVKGKGRVSGEQVVRLLAELDAVISTAVNYVPPESAQVRRNKLRRVKQSA
jgi:hypothetical protein